MFQPFDKFLFRCPVFPFNVTPNYPCYFSIQKEAIFLASPELADEVEKMKKKEAGKRIRTELSFLKYQNRMRSRCTPFGLFAGCGTGATGDTSEIRLKKSFGLFSKTRSDMNILFSLAQALGRMDIVKKQSVFFQNSSLYKTFNSYRYVEYEYVNGMRKYTLSEIEDSPYLITILEICRFGATFHEMQMALSVHGVSGESANEYINSLISNQVLVNNLEPSVTGDDLLTEMNESVKKYGESLSEITNALEEISNQLDKIDSTEPGRSRNPYLNIEHLVQKLNIEYKKKFLFQTDLLISPRKATLSKKIFDNTADGIQVLSRLFPYKESQVLLKFKEDFYARYEEEEIPLVEALDPDIGIGIADLTSGNTDFHPLIDFIDGKTKDETNTVQISKTELFLLKKYNECITSGAIQFSVEDEELQHFKERTTPEWPPTFSATIEVIRPDTIISDPVLLIRYAGGSSGANLLNRFCHLSPDIKDFAAQIIKKENEIIGDTAILAEITHLPESRTGNILFRPVLREYEIPYMSKASVSDEFVIPVTDLFISVNLGRFIQLRSKKLNKEIIPRLTTAHNFHRNSLPIYHFLCLLQSDNLRTECSFQWGSYLSQKKFLPRAVWRNVILSPAYWNVRKKDFDHIPPYDSPNFPEKLKHFKDDRRIPDIVQLVLGDQKLLIDFNNDKMVQLFYHEVKNKDFMLEEVIFDEQHPLITQGSYYFRNEIILAFYKTK